jgi:hypothetical protein
MKLAYRLSYVHQAKNTTTRLACIAVRSRRHKSQIRERNRRSNIAMQAHSPWLHKECAKRRVFV